MAMAGSKTIEKGLAILEELAQSAAGKTASELAKTVGVHKTSIYRYLNAFSAPGYIRRDGEGRYHIANKILELGNHMLRRMPLREVAHPHLVKLSADTQKTVHLCILDGFDVIYIDKVESHRTLPINSRIGSRAPCHCSSAGKALLSELPTEQVVSLCQQHGLPQRTPNTITNPLRLLQELRAVTERGYAIDDEEDEIGLMCLGTSIRGYGSECLGAVSLTGLKREFDNSDTCNRLVKALLDTASVISRALGNG